MAEPFADLDARLRADGWQRGFPKKRGLIDGVSIDQQVCSTETCEECGHYGLVYVSYVDPERRISQTGYTAVYRCPACDMSDEF